MKKILLIILILVTTTVFLGLASMDKQYFICPIEYQSDIIIRNDHRGEGLFATSRSGRRMHQGVDLFAPVGTPILAAKNGKVISATQNKGMGKYIIIRHKNNMTSIYGHLSKILVHKDDSVHQGQIIGSVGKTGNARFRDIFPHLHFEIRKNGIPQDPLEYI